MTPEDVKQLEQAGKDLLHRFISDLWVLYESGFDIQSVLAAMREGKHVDIDSLLSYNQSSNFEGEVE